MSVAARMQKKKGGCVCARGATRLKRVSLIVFIQNVCSRTGCCVAWSPEARPWGARRPAQQRAGAAFFVAVQWPAVGSHYLAKVLQRAGASRGLALSYQGAAAPECVIIAHGRVRGRT